MRFDLIANFSPGETIPWTRTLEMILQQCTLAEQAGFTTAWFTEHHFAHNGYMNAPPNPIQMATHVAAHCKKLRVGTAPIVLPDWHPLRVAEDIAMLDNMTLGRVDFGVAKGINERATLQFNRDAGPARQQQGHAALSGIAGGDPEGLDQRVFYPQRRILSVSGARLEGDQPLFRAARSALPRGRRHL